MGYKKVDVEFKYASSVGGGLEEEVVDRRRVICSGGWTDKFDTFGLWTLIKVKKGRE